MGMTGFLYASSILVEFALGDLPAPPVFFDRDF